MHGVKRVTLTEELRLEKEKKEAIKVEQFKKLTSTIQTLKGKDDKTQELLDKLAAQLSMNPDLTTSYNLRREVIKKRNYTEADWDKELNFTLKLLTSNPKSYPLWQHRSWILNEINQDEYYQKELNLTYKLLSMDKRNFHGWSYRREILDILHTRLSAEELDDLYLKEWEYLTMMINSDISNYSAWHQRRILILHYMNKSDGNKIPEGDVHSLIKKEGDYIYNAIFTDAEDQSVWNYMKWFVTDNDIAKLLKEHELSELVDKFLEAMQEINEDEVEFNGKPNKWCTLMIIFLEDRYKREFCLNDRKKLFDSLKTIDPLRATRYQEMSDQI